MRKSKILFVALTLVSIATVGCEQRTAMPMKSAPLMPAAVAGLVEVQSGSTGWSALATNQPVLKGSVVRTRADSSVTMNSQVSSSRMALGEGSEVGVEEWAVSDGSASGAEEAGLNVRRGVVVVDVPILSGVSKFEVKGSNFVAGMRSGAAVVAITAEGSVLVRSGTVVCVFLSPNVKAVNLNAGEMVDPRSVTVKAIPAESNAVWNLLRP